jgi:NAD(P)-dependent dehydrogenase (short-subunit alcohol dehydrogenase family)
MSKVWLITGSARGLGRNILEAALAAGESVLATARDPGRLADLKVTYGERIETFALDVTDAEGAQAAVNQAIKTFGRLDVLVNNAGYGHFVPFEQTSAADFKAQVDTNFYGVVNMVRAALPVMRTQKSGYIINISSIGGRTGAPGLSAYQSAKWAVGGFTEVLAQEAAPFGVKVIAVEPGGMRTDWGFIAMEKQTDLLPEYQHSVGMMLGLIKKYAGNEVGDPKKIADVVVDLTGHEVLPAHLILGSDALGVYEQVEGGRARAAKEWLAVSRSVDVEGADLSSLSEAGVI